MIPAAVVYFFDMDAFVQCQSDSLGLLRADGAVIRVPVAAEHKQELGNTILDAMRRSRTGLARGTGIDEEVWKSHFKALGITSWQEFDKEARRVTVWTVDGQIEVMLWGAQDPQGGRSGIEESTVYLSSSASPEEFGVAVLTALQSCT